MVARWSELVKRRGYVVMVLREGERLRHVPAQLDCLSGAGRPASRLDGGPLDRALGRWGGGGRCASVFHARKSFGRPGEHHVGYDDVEEQLGLSRTYKVELADRDRTEDVVKALRDLPQVESAAVQIVATTPFDASTVTEPKVAEAWEPHERIRAREAQAIEPGDERVSASIVDTGIVVGHPEFQRKCLAGYDTVDLGMGRVNEQIRLVGDSRGHDYNPYDDVGHGCHVAGVIGARGWRLPPGVAGRSLLLAIRVLAAAVSSSSGRRVGVGALSDIDAGMKVAVDLGASVINMSFGTPEASVDPLGPVPHRQVVGYAARYGCVLVAAAGNSGIRERYYPAALPEVIAVGSVDRQGLRSRFSTWGDHVAICAPGERIVSVSRRAYQVNTGTSFAAPFVAGVAALVLSRARRAGRRVTGADVKRILTESASPLGGGGFHPETGHGFLDSVAAIRRMDRFLGRTS